MKRKNNSMFTRIIFLLVGLVVDTFGNGLTIASGNGSAVWTASSVNMSNWSNISVSVLIFAFGVLYALLNQILLAKIDLKRFFSEVVFMVLFSYGINLFTKFFLIFHINEYNYLITAIASIIGVTCIGIAISLYQRTNIIMHPNDDNTNILRFKYLHGSAPLAQLINMAPAIILIIISGLITGRLDAINIGTVYYFLGVGFVIKYSDSLIVPKLIHNVKGNGKL